MRGNYVCFQLLCTNRSSNFPSSIPNKVNLGLLLPEHKVCPSCPPSPKSTVCLRKDSRFSFAARGTCEDVLGVKTFFSISALCSLGNLTSPTKFGDDISILVQQLASAFLPLYNAFTFLLTELSFVVVWSLLGIFCVLFSVVSTSSTFLFIYVIHTSFITCKKTSWPPHSAFSLRVPCPEPLFSRPGSEIATLPEQCGRKTDACHKCPNHQAGSNDATYLFNPGLLRNWK